MIASNLPFKKKFLVTPNQNFCLRHKFSSFTGGIIGVILDMIKVLFASGLVQPQRASAVIRY